MLLWKGGQLGGGGKGEGAVVKYMNPRKARPPTIPIRKVAAYCSPFSVHSSHFDLAVAFDACANLRRHIVIYHKVMHKL